MVQATDSSSGADLRIPARGRRAEALAVQRQAYYRVLETDPAFCAALQGLYARLYPELSRARSPEARFEAIRRRDRRGLDPRAERAVERFVARWHLPKSYTFELRYGLDQARYSDAAVGLCALRGHIASPLPLRAIRPAATPEAQVALEAFIYDHADDPVVAADRRLQPVREALIAQMRDQQRQAIALGWRRPGPWLRNSADVMVRATRLYRRAVHGWSPQEIANAEQREHPEATVTAHAVAQSIATWAKALGVDVPPSPIGRPRRKSQSYRASQNRVTDLPERAAVTVLREAL